MIILEATHNGGDKENIILERFAFRAGLLGDGEDLDPIDNCLEFEAKDRMQITNFVKRVKRSSKLKEANISINITHEKLL
jgi:hypothetical protein